MDEITLAKYQLEDDTERCLNMSGALLEALQGPLARIMNYAIALEREACARVAESKDTLFQAAEAIRARSNDATLANIAALDSPSEVAQG